VAERYAGPPVTLVSAHDWSELIRALATDLYGRLTGRFKRWWPALAEEDGPAACGSGKAPAARGC
jgi:hypothetical protein